MREKKYNYTYQIVNIINGKKYYGVHSTNKLDDGYMGSGKALKLAIKKYGIDNFTKIILKFYSSREEATIAESKLVTRDIVNDNDYYNLILGGGINPMMGLVSVFDTTTQTNRVVTMEEYRNNKEQYKSHNYNWVTVFDIIDETYKRITCENYYNNKERYILNHQKDGNKSKKSSNILKEGYVTVQDFEGNRSIVSVDDERYINGELIPCCRGKISKDGIVPYQKSKSFSEKLRQRHKETGFQKGEHNSHYNTYWVYNESENITKMIPKEELDLYLSKGFCRGRKINKNNK